MSVIVLGMEMSTTCVDCELYHNGGEYGGYGSCEAHWVIFGKEDDWVYETRPNWCPLRPLPKRHGILIEAERLRAEFPYPSEGMGGWRNPDEALVHKTGIWAAIDCAETIVESEGD